MISLAHSWGVSIYAAYDEGVYAWDAIACLLNKNDIFLMHLWIFIPGEIRMGAFIHR